MPAFPYSLFDTEANKQQAEDVAGGLDNRLAYEKRQQDYWESIGQHGHWSANHNWYGDDSGGGGGQPNAPVQGLEAAAPPTSAPDMPPVSGDGGGGGAVATPAKTAAPEQGANGGGMAAPPEQAAGANWLSAPGSSRQGIGTRTPPQLNAILAGLGRAY